MAGSRSPQAAGAERGTGALPLGSADGIPWLAQGVPGHLVGPGHTWQPACVQVFTCWQLLHTPGTCSPTRANWPELHSGLSPDSINSITAVGRAIRATFSCCKHMASRCYGISCRTVLACAAHHQQPDHLMPATIRPVLSQAGCTCSTGLRHAPDAALPQTQDRHTPWHALIMP